MKIPVLTRPMVGRMPRAWIPPVNTQEKRRSSRRFSCGASVGRIRVRPPLSNPYTRGLSCISELLAHRQSDQPGIERDRFDFRAALRGHVRFKVELLDIEVDEVILVQRIAEPRLQDGTGIRLEILQTIESRSALLEEHGMV